MANKKTSTKATVTKDAAKAAKKSAPKAKVKATPATGTAETAETRDGDAPKARKAAPADTASARPKLSLVKAAIAVLGETEEAMGAKELVEAAKAKGLWTPGDGKTPEQTLYSAISREIKTKGGRSRFAAAGKGKFKLAEAPAAE